MNVLMTVLSLILVLTVLTTAKIDSYATQTLLRHSVEQTLRAQEAHWRFEAADASYQAQQGRKQNSASKGKGKQSEQGAKLSTMLNLSSLQQLADQEAGQQLQELLKRLIKALYQNQRFYKAFMARQLEAGRSEDQILQELVEKIVNFLAENKLGNKKKLAEIDLRDLELQNFFAKMFNGSLQTGINSGYKPLIEFLKVERSSTEKISVYSCRRPLLVALFGNSPAIDDLMAVRKEIHRQYSKGEIEQEAAAQRLRAVSPPSDFPNLLDFGVSKSVPKD